LPQRRGFDEVLMHGAGGIGQDGFGDFKANAQNKYFDNVLLHNETIVKTKGFCTDLFFSAALSWMRKQYDAETPFFAYVSLNAPHGPLIAPDKYKKRFLEEGYSEPVAARYGMIENIDDNVGVLMKRLADWQVLDNTLVIFMTDNGMAMKNVGKKGTRGLTAWNAGMRGTKDTNWEGGTRVPSFWSWAGVLPEGVDVPALTAHVDLYRTFCELAGTEIPSSKLPPAGRSLLPLLENPEAAWADRTLFAHRGRWGGGGRGKKTRELAKYYGASVRTARWRLVYEMDGEGPWLSDVTNDPGESKNFIEEYPEVAQRLKSEFDEWWDFTEPFLVNEGLPRLQRGQYPLQLRYDEQARTKGIPDWAPQALEPTAVASNLEWQGKKSDWRGYQRFDFQVDGRNAFVVVSKRPTKERLWVWRARFPKYHPEVDQLLLDRGFYVAYLDTDDMLGSPRALEHWDAFYAYLTKEKGLAKKVALEAVSRGGLFAYRWAARNPDAVACIYADVPVCDFKSWPLGKGLGLGHPKSWRNLLKQYDLTEAEALAYAGNPIDQLEPIAKKQIPLLHVISLNDRVVPAKENTLALAERYRKLGGSIEIIEVPNATRVNGHHFDHPDPDRAADFIEQYAKQANRNANNPSLPKGELATIVPVPSKLKKFMPKLHEEKLKEARSKKVDFVMIGDSITHGWAREFPDAFKGINLLNLGFPGDRTQNVLWRIENGAVDGISPKLVTMMIGTNHMHVAKKGYEPDAPKDVFVGIQTVVRELKQRLPDSKILLFSVFPREPAEAYERVKAVNAMLPQLADGKRVFHHSINPAFLDDQGALRKELYNRDRLHLNRHGYAVWAEALNPLLATHGFRMNRKQPEK
jgi:arylsulfatase